MTTTAANIARGPRGQFLGGARGDLTGQKFLRLADQKERLDQAVKSTRNALVSEPVELVTVPGGRIYAVPRQAFEHLLAIGAGE
jgi:hypothetical protein